MGIKHSEFSKMIFESIDNLFAEEIGPVAPILCEESLNEWIRELKNSGQRVGLKTIPLYVNRLANQIEDPVNRNKFTDAVYEIEALKFFKLSNGGNK
jgi:hypothetical protein